MKKRPDEERGGPKRPESSGPIGRGLKGAIERRMKSDANKVDPSRKKGKAKFASTENPMKSKIQLINLMRNST